MISRIIILVSIIYSTSAELAPFITKCKAEDNKCMKETAQNAIPLFGAGIPQLGVEQLDPCHIDRLDASSLGLNLFLKDVTASGLKDCVARKVTRDVANSKISVKLQCNIDFIGKYEVNGTLLFIPLTGKGDAHVVLNKLVIFAEGNIAEYTGPDGQTHWTIKKWTHNFELKDKSTLQLSNLFDGNEALASVANNVLTEHSNEVIKEVGPPIVKAVAERIIKNVESFFKNVPVSELTLD